MDERLRQTVRERADYRCEYCCLPQSAEPFFAYHVEHIVARQHGGRDDSENLALACYHCNAHKGPNLMSQKQMLAPSIGVLTQRSSSFAREVDRVKLRASERKRFPRAEIAVFLNTLL